MSEKWWAKLEGYQIWLQGQLLKFRTSNPDPREIHKKELMIKVGGDVVLDDGAIFNLHLRLGVSNG